MNDAKKDNDLFKKKLIKLFMQNLIIEDRQFKIQFHCSLIIFHPHDCKLFFESSSSAIIPLLYIFQPLHMSFQSISKDPKYSFALSHDCVLLVTVQ